MQYKVYGNLKKELRDRGLNYDDLRQVFIRTKGTTKENVGKRWIQMRMNANPPWDLEQCSQIMTFLGIDPKNNEWFLYLFRDGPRPSGKVAGYDPDQLLFADDIKSKHPELFEILTLLAPRMEELKELADIVSN